MLFPIDPHQTFQPPERGVQAVGMMRGHGRKPGRLQPPFELPPAVDAHVSSGRGGVVLRQAPADALGPRPRDAQREGPSGHEHAVDLTQDRGVVRDVLEHLGADGQIEAARGEGQLHSVSGAQPPASAAVLSQPLVQLEALVRGVEVRQARVQPDHERSRQAEGRGRVPAGPAADVQDAAPRRGLNARAVDGDHRWPPGRRRRSPRRRGAR